jgi:hypothetical protein
MHQTFSRKTNAGGRNGKTRYAAAIGRNNHKATSSPFHRLSYVGFHSLAILIPERIVNRTVAEASRREM